MRAGPWKNNGCGFQGLEKRAGDLAADRAGLNNMATIDNHPKFFEDIACRRRIIRGTLSAGRRPGGIQE
jgi:hypothetical protein